MKEALPQIIFIIAIAINLLSSFMDPCRNSKASLIATLFLLGITYWGGFYQPLFNLLKA